MVSAFISFLNDFNLFQSSLRIKPKFFVKWWKLHSKYSISELLFLILLENFTEFAVVFRLSSYCGHSFVRSSFPVNFLNDIAYKSLIFNVENQRANVIGKFSNVQFIHLFFCNLLIKWKFSKTSTKQSFNWIFFFPFHIQWSGDYKKNVNSLETIWKAYNQEMKICSVAKGLGLQKISKQDVSTVNSLDYQRWNTTLTGWRHLLYNFSKCNEKIEMRN